MRQRDGLAIELFNEREYSAQISGGSKFAIQGSSQSHAKEVRLTCDLLQTCFLSCKGTYVKRWMKVFLPCKGCLVLDFRDVKVKMRGRSRHIFSTHYENKDQKVRKLPWLKIDVCYDRMALQTAVL